MGIVGDIAKKTFRKTYYSICPYYRVKALLGNYKLFYAELEILQSMSEKMLSNENDFRVIIRNERSNGSSADTNIIKQLDVFVERVIEEIASICTTVLVIDYQPLPD